MGNKISRCLKNKIREIKPEDVRSSETMFVIRKKQLRMTASVWLCPSGLSHPFAVRPGNTVFS